MKYKVTIAVLFLFVTIANAQSPFHFGVKADLNFFSVRGDGMDTKFGTGIQGGVFGNYDFNSKWSVQPEIFINQSNTKRSADFMTFYPNSGKLNGDDAIKLTYLSVPVLAKYNITKMFSVLAGPEYSFMLFDNDDLRANDQDAFKKGELSGNLGAQFNISSVSFYGRYNFGLGSINNIDDRYSWHSSRIQLGVSVRIK